MKIREISYSQLFSFGRFQNEEIGYTAEINEDENPEQVHGKLRRKAILQHHMNQQAREQAEHVEYIKEIQKESLTQVKNLLSRIHELRNRFNEADYKLDSLERLENKIHLAEAQLKELISRKEETLEELSR